jgi:microsomal dipeptidase-like Zn-dependent dipeptidase
MTSRLAAVSAPFSCLTLCLLATVMLVACGGAEAPVEEPTAPETEAELMARARAIHERVITLDTHVDIPENFATPGEDDPGMLTDRKVDLPKMREGGLDGVFFVVYVGQPRAEDWGLNEEGYAQAYEAAIQKFHGIHRLTEEMHPDEIGLATSADDVERLAAEGKLIAAIGVENGYSMGEDLSRIAEFKELGAGYMGITHTGHNQLGDSHSPADQPLHGGLSELGRQAVAEMNRQGIMVDVSHAGRQTTLDVLEVSQAPIIASHSSAQAVHDVTRNMSDEELLALKENGGVVQAVALGSYVKGSPERDEAMEALREEMGLPGFDARGRRAMAEMTEQEIQALREAFVEYQRRVAEEIDPQFPPPDVSDFVDHIDYIVELIGIDHVGISSDFDGGGGIVGWNDASETFNVTLELVKRGYTEEEIGKIWSGNLLRVWREVEQVAERLQAEGDM